jgi:hypothetical protein
MQPRIYTYKITFEEVPYYYYGVHKERKYDEYYMGSPETHKWCWEIYTAKKQILEVFPYTDDGWLEANKVEQRIIKAFYNTDKWCLNESCGGVCSLKIHREVGKRTQELGIGIFSQTKEQLQENGRKTGTKYGCVGGKKSAKKRKELKTGIFGLTKEQMIENSKKSSGGQVVKELGLGICGLTKEQRIENGKKYGSKAGKLGSAKTNSQEWMCLETGYITNAGALTTYQRARGIDTSKRKQVK